MDRNMTSVNAQKNSSKASKNTMSHRDSINLKAESSDLLLYLIKNASNISVKSFSFVCEKNR